MTHSSPDRAASDELEHLGVLEWFRVGEHERVEQVLDWLAQLDVRRLRTGVSWADAHSPGGFDWYAWLLPKLARQLEVLPCFHYTPPSLGLARRSNAPPKDPEAFAQFLDAAIDAWGDHFEWVELWNEPANLSEWDWTLDHQWDLFCHMIGSAGYWAQQRGKKTLLGGLQTYDPNFVEMLSERGVLGVMNAIGLHGFPGTWSINWPGWPDLLARARATLDALGQDLPIWVTETGYSTVRYDEHAQLPVFVEALEAPVERVYWYGLQDLHPSEAAHSGFHLDEREYHFGAVRADGTPKLLFRLWRDFGAEGVRDTVHRLEQARRRSAKRRSGPAPVLITGGAGFIGSRLAARLARAGQPVRVLDNLSRRGSEANLARLAADHGEQVDGWVGDVRDPTTAAAVDGVRAIVHLVTDGSVATSRWWPARDFSIHAEGTLQLLEAVRHRPWRTPLIHASTSRVYGPMTERLLRRDELRWVPVAGSEAIDEDQPLDPHTPLACSQQAAEAMVRDHARSLGMITVVLRFGTVYGPHQDLEGDDAWLTRAMMQARTGQAVEVPGDGRAVRDVLSVEDAVEALLAALRAVEEEPDSISGRAFNIGGGPERTVSWLELLDWLTERHGHRPKVREVAWPAHEPRHYVSDIRRFRRATGWGPRQSLADGLAALDDGLKRSRQTDAVLGDGR